MKFSGRRRLATEMSSSMASRWMNRGLEQGLARGWSTSACGRRKSDPVSLDTVWTTMTAAKEAGHEGQGAEADHDSWQ